MKDADSFLDELRRVTSKHVFIAMPNPLQLGYLMRKNWLEPEFFDGFDERWTRVPWVLLDAGTWS